jgi:hypothetical protein
MIKISRRIVYQPARIAGRVVTDEGLVPLPVGVLLTEEVPLPVEVVLVEVPVEEGLVPGLGLFAKSPIVEVPGPRF